jgi:exoribonuclease II
VIVTSRTAVVLIGTFPKATLDGEADAVLTPVPETLYGIAIQLPPAIGHSNTFVVPDEAVAAVGEKRCFTLHVPGPANPPPVPHVSKSKENGTLMPDPDAISVRYPASTVIDTSRTTVVLIGTFPKATLDGEADARLTPVPDTLYGMAIQLPPAIGHSKTFVVPLDAVAAVGEKRCFTLHVPGPANPPPVPHVSNSKANGALMPDPDAISVR